MTLRNTFIAVGFYRLMEHHLLPRLTKIFKTPNQITVAGLGLALLVPFGFYINSFWGFLFITGSGLTDTLDGLMAKTRHMKTAYGAFLDSSLDRLSDFFYLTGFWVLFRSDDRFILSSLLIFTAYLFTFMISYIKAKAESLGCRCETGFMDRGLRTLYLILWALLICLVPSSHTLRWSGLILYCGATFLTVIQRFIHIRNKLDELVKSQN